MQPVWEITIRNKEPSWTLFSTFTRSLPQWLSPPRMFQALFRTPHWPGASIRWQKAHVHMARNTSLWGVGSSAWSLNSVQDWEETPLLICSQCRAHRSKYLTQSGNDHTHTPRLGFCYYREHKNLKSKSLWRDSLSHNALLTYSALTNALVSFLAGIWAQNSWCSRQGNFGMFMSVHKIKLNSLLVPSSNLARQFPLQSLLPTQKQLQLINQVENPSARNLSRLCSRVKSSSSWKTLAMFDWVQVQVLLFESMAVNESVHMIIRNLKGWCYLFSCNEIPRKYLVFNKHLLNVKYSKMGMHHIIWLTFTLRTERNNSLPVWSGW